MNDLTLKQPNSTLTIDEAEGGIVMRIKELVARECEITKGAKPVEFHKEAQIWLDQRAILRLYAFLRDVIPDTEEELNGYDVDN